MSRKEQAAHGQQQPGSDVSRRRFLRRFAGTAAVLGCGAAAGATWLLTRPESSERKKRRALDSGIPIYTFEVVKSYPHDSDAYTQGLLYHQGELYESTGQYKHSSLWRVEIATGKVLDSVRLDDKFFGEGLALVGDELFQLTWKEKVVLVYDRATLREKRRPRYEGIGWGLTYNGRHLIASDGSDRLYFLNPETLEPQRYVSVRLDGVPQDRLNELEYIAGEVWANLYPHNPSEPTDYIVRIDPQSGEVTGFIDLARLWPGDQQRPDDTPLNGIAYDDKGKRLFVTGKDWPSLYEIKLVKS